MGVTIISIGTQKNRRKASKSDRNKRKRSSQVEKEIRRGVRKAIQESTIYKLFIVTPRMPSYLKRTQIHVAIVNMTYLQRKTPKLT
jgi:hypothetical protein